MRMRMTSFSYGKRLKKNGWKRGFYLKKARKLLSTAIKKCSIPQKHRYDIIEETRIAQYKSKRKNEKKNM